MERDQTKSDYMRGVRFRGNSLVHSVNGIHPYPGMMVPTVIESVLDEYGSGATSILDPFCGTGRTLVAGRQRGMAAIGIDINPLATLVASLRVNAPAGRGLLELAQNVISRARRGGGRAVRKRVSDIAFDFAFWYPHKVIDVLANLLSAIEDLTGARTKGRLFLLVCYSECARICSYTREAEHKLYRVNPRERSAFRVDVLTVFERVVRKNWTHLDAFCRTRTSAWSKGTADVICGEIGAVCHGGLCKRRFDALITSPPYGDARTTVAYGEFSRLPLLWMLAMRQPPFVMDFKAVLALDRNSLGGHCEARFAVEGRLAIATIDRLLSRNPQRGRQVAAFMVQLNDAMRAACKLVRHGGLVAFIVGRRVVAGLRIPLDEIILEWSSLLGIRIATVMRRSIPYKRLPRYVAKRGVQGRNRILTMLEEHVLVGHRR